MKTHVATSKMKLVLSPEEVAAEYGLSLGTLANDRWRRRGIPFYKLRRRVLYKRVDVERYVFGNPVKTIDSLHED